MKLVPSEKLNVNIFGEFLEFLSSHLLTIYHGPWKWYAHNTVSAYTYISIYKSKQTSKSAESKHKKKIRLQFWQDLPMTLKIYQEHQQNIKGWASSWIFFTTYQQHGVISAWITHSQLLYTGSIQMVLSMNHTFTVTPYQLNTQVTETQVWPSA